jgi:hypothetical protein
MHRGLTICEESDRVSTSNLLKMQEYGGISYSWAETKDPKAK